MAGRKSMVSIMVRAVFIGKYPLNWFEISLESMEDPKKIAVSIL